MGMIVYVYRDHLRDCTNGGVSSKCDTLTVVNVEGPFEPTADRPAARLESHRPGIVRIVPVDLDPARLGPMFGGNFAATSDSRFRWAVEQMTGAPFYGAVAIHDRQE